jgi:hypothetical protein
MNSPASYPASCYAAAGNKGNMSLIPEYLIKMIRRVTPEGCDVVENSTPVISFGNPGRAKIATLGINPSDVEFVENRVFLTGDKRRLATRLSLGGTPTELLTDAQMQEVVDDCNNYFHRRPYGWFDSLDKILMAGFNASYKEGSACHLDLVQWATNTKWDKLNPDIKRELLKESEVHLVNQLQAENITQIVVNGRAVWKEIKNLNLVKFEEVKTIYFGKVGGRQTSCKLRIGHGCGATFYGWTSNIPTQHGTKNNIFHQNLGLWLKEVGND